MSTFTWIRGSLARALLLLAAAVIVGSPLGCSDSGRASGTPEGNGPRPDNRTATGPCKAGDSQSCSVTIGVHDGILSCFEGTQSCVDGTWAGCSDGSYNSYKAPAWVKAGSPGGAKFLALSSAGPCASNPCDPGCRQWNEVPDGGFNPTILDGGGAPAVPDGGVPFDWQQGSYDSYPPGTMRNDQCTGASDCQLNTRCVGPYSGGCEHHQCDTGVGLTDGCNPCVSDICAQPATAHCCAPAACSHDPCITGSALGQTCDPCVTNVCLAQPSCCTGTWDASCVALIGTQCGGLGESCKCRSGQVTSPDGLSCYEMNKKATTWEKAEIACEAIAPGASWHLADIRSQTENDLVKGMMDKSHYAWLGASDRITEGTWQWIDGSAVSYTHWNSGEPNNQFNEDCAMMYPQSNGGFFGFFSSGSLGYWNDAQCGNVYYSVCKGLPPALAHASGPPPGGSWDQACVDAVASVCGAQCALDPVGGQLSSGQCIPWFPEQKDPTCPGYDLTVAPTCGGTVPVCNHGNDWSPVGMKVGIYPSGTFAATPQNPPSAPNEKSEPLVSPIATCDVPDQIAPGWCMDVPCSPSSNQELLVNPPGAGHDALECRQDNNWGLYRGLACGGPVCSANATASTKTALNLFMMVDRSSQMDTNPPKLLWWAAADAIKSFVADPKSADIHVALRFFPDNPTWPVLPYPPAGYTAPHTGCSALVTGGTSGGFFFFGGTSTAGTAPCVAASCAEPLVDGMLQYMLAPTDQAEANLIAAVNQTAPEPATTSGGFFSSSTTVQNTPLYPALAGALSWAEEGKLAHPDQQWAVVLITAGQPSGGCDNSVTDIAALAAAAYAAPYNVKTYVVGMEAAQGGTPINQTTANTIATAGGTTAFWVSATDVNATQTVVHALQAVAGQAAQCSLPLPNTGKFDPATANVNFVPSTPPAGFTPACRSDEKEFNGRCYTIVKNGSGGSSGGFLGFFGGGTTAKNVTWVIGRDECRNIGEGWDLVKIESSAENNWIKSTFGFVLPSWVGGNERATVAKWVWADGAQFWQGVTGGTAMPAGSYAAWGSGQPAAQPSGFFAPSCSGGWGCMKMNADGTWSAQCCGDNGTAICEGPKIAPAPTACDTGQVFGPDLKCYERNDTALTWQQARDACIAKGAGWDLAAPKSDTINTFVASRLYAADDIWLGVRERADDSWERVDGTQIWSTPVPSCRAGETARLAEDGTTHCYVLKSTAENWSDMRTGGRTYSCGFSQTCTIPPGCTDLGPGFDLVRIDSSAENTFVQTMSGGTSVWTGGNETSNPGTWRWPDNTAFWQDPGVCQ